MDAPAGVATQKRRVSPRVAYRGPSLIDGGPIRVVVYALNGDSRNAKIGGTAQVLISPDIEPPNVAMRTGMDRAVCGDCAHRPRNGGGCYVVPNYGLLAPWYATTELAADLAAACSAIIKSDLPLRVGGWGDPAAVPFEVTDALVRAAAKNGRPRHMAYSSSWRTCDQRLRGIAMASVCSEDEREEAHALGWRTFRIRADGMARLEGERICPASKEAGAKTTCARCLACNGSGASRDIVVVGHGSANKLVGLERLLRRDGAAR